MACSFTDTHFTSSTGRCRSAPAMDNSLKPRGVVGGSKQHYLYQHFCSKFLHLCEDVCGNDTMSAWMKFYRILDRKWAERLMQYVYCEWRKDKAKN